MKLVIDLPEKLYNYIKSNNYDEHLDRRFDYMIRFAVREGIPLPKGHGGLIDVDDIRVIELEDGLHIIRHEKGDEIDVYIDAPTIIEADEGETE